MALTKDDIELIELISVDEMPSSRPANPTPRGNYWKVTLGFKDGYGNITLSATWYLLKKETPDSSVLPIARNYLHRLCIAIADQTGDWHLDDAQYQALKRPAKAP
jgi:hypothetical protein